MSEDLELHPAGNRELSTIFHLLKKIKKLWWLFALIGLLGGVIGFYYAYKQNPVYESYLTFALDEGGSENISGAAGLAAQFGLSFGNAKDVFTGDNILEIMLSRRIIERVLLSTDSFNGKSATLIEFYLHSMEGEKNKKISDVHFYVGEQKTFFNYTKDSILYHTFLDFQTKKISARRPDKKLNIFELGVTSNNEQFSKIFTDKLINETIGFYTEISSKKARETLEILEKRLPDMKGRLDATITNKAAIQDANLNPAFAEAQVPLIKEQTNSQVFGAAYAEMFKNLEMARFQYLKSIPLMQIIDAADYPMKKIKPSKIKTAFIFSFIFSFIFLLIFIGLTIVRSNIKPGEQYL